jgi:hypothetical protein
MSALGHKRTFAAQKGGALVNVRFVPIADIRSECVFAAPRFESETRLIDLSQYA